MSVILVVTAQILQTKQKQNVVTEKLINGNKVIDSWDMEGADRMKELYIVRDVPRYEEECSNYCYVVRAESHAEAIAIVRQKTKCQWDWEAELADNKEIWE